ncbi:GxxExxY protein [Candidatus Microgenomates bacterium]|nr:GxxExxY protein [Candidatus Microgenomates bacterium]
MVQGYYPDSDLTDKIIGSAIEVHKKLGPGYPEKIYQRALAEEFRRRSIPFTREETFRVIYEGKDIGYEVMDFRVYKKIVVELKAVREIMDLHAKQLVGYLKAAKLQLGLILNFGKSKLEIKRVIV